LIANFQNLTFQKQFFMKVSFHQNEVKAPSPGKMQLIKLIAIAFFSFLALVFSLTAFAQNITVKGRITNETGQPVPGASVFVKGTTVGVSSNAEGNFEISSASNAALIISSVGYATKEVNVSGQATLNIRLGNPGY
jgi:TonB-dependent starch-binding outer membrane protein SusC